MRAFLTFLTRQRSGVWANYGVSALVVGLISVLRFFVPLNTAPFLLYMPAVFVIGVALGRGPASLSMVISTVFAAWFFWSTPPYEQLSPAQLLALAQYVVIGGAMVLVCDALRQLLVENTSALAEMTELNAALTSREATLATARNEALAAREEALAAKGEAERARLHAEAAQGVAEKASEAAEQANTAKSAFIANMSHELRTPLSAIIGYSEMMIEEIEDGGEVADFGADIRKVEGNARHLLGLINDVLDLSKVESGKMDVYPEAFDIEPVIRDVAATAHTLVERNGNSLDLRVAPGLGRMASDLTKVRQILLNLLSNAAKFTERGTVTLAVHRELFEERDHVVFVVTDTGIGMSEEQLSRLFQRFVQADISTTRKYGGTGLGLSLTKALSEMLGGGISVESEVGRGTVFTVRVPASYQVEGVTAVSEPEDLGAHGGDLVLVIDDDPDQRALMTKFLHREGFLVRTADNGTTGLALARDLTPRAILLDVMMPGVDGWSVLSALKADPTLDAIPVIMVTFVEQRALAASLGAADYVMKPVRWDRFKAVMDRYRPPEAEVLIVDDDADSRSRLRKVLERDGWSVAEAGNGREGLERLGMARPGLVLLDLTMPVMDGFAFLEAMRARPDCSDIPVVVLTALDLTWEDRRRLHGASSILHKGDINMRALAERLQSLALGSAQHEAA